MNPLRVIQVTTHLSRRGGGLFESVRYLSQELQKNNIMTEAAGVDDAYSPTDLKFWTPVPVHTFPVRGPESLAYAPGLARFLRTSSPDLAHLHGLWQYPAAAVRNWSRRSGRPHVLSTRGMLEPWALGRSRLKKKLAGALYQDACLREAACLHATAPSEVESIRRYGLKNPVALIANGAAVPRELPPRASPSPNGRRRALFLSRIHPKKGLLDLVRAWSALRQSGPPAQPPWELHLMGPDEDHHLSEVMAAVQAAGLQDEIFYDGEVWDEKAKIKCYCDADLFLLPSHSENFGLVIAEALGCGIPVVTTRATPWEALKTHRCGWWIEPGPEPLEQALREVWSLSPEELRAMGQRGREMVSQRFSWETAGRQMSAVYDWISGRGPQPDCILN